MIAFAAMLAARVWDAGALDAYLATAPRRSA